MTHLYRSGNIDAERVFDRFPVLKPSFCPNSIGTSSIVIPPTVDSCEERRPIRKARSRLVLEKHRWWVHFKNLEIRSSLPFGDSSKLVYVTLKFVSIYL